LEAITLRNLVGLSFSPFFLEKLFPGGNYLEKVVLEVCFFMHEKKGKIEKKKSNFKPLS
jgi:hypothetical protein